MGVSVVTDFPAPSGVMQLHRQSAKLRIWTRSRLWAQVMIGMVLGLIVGAALGPAAGWVSPASAKIAAAWLALPSQVFLGLIAIVLVPLVFASIVSGLTGTSSGAALRKIGLRLGVFVLTTTMAAAWIGITLARIFQPGAGFESPVVAPDSLPADPQAFDFTQLPEIVASVLPTNPAASVMQGDLLAVVLLALLTGVAATQVQKERVQPFLAFLDALLSISMTVVKWAMMLTPYAVFGLMAQLMMQIGLASLLALVNYVGVVLLGLFLLIIVYLVVLAILRQISPRQFFSVAGQNLLLAFSTSSSSAVMPSTIQTVRRFDVPTEVANLVIPIGATMNMAGTALYQSIAIIFLAQMAGVELSHGAMILITGTLVASSIGAPGTPGVSIAILASVAAGFGIPAEGLVIILGVDRLLDMARTVVNVTGDITAAVLLRDTLGHARRGSPH